MKKNNIKTSSTDVTGRKSIVRNVIISWASQLVYIVAGFILPRILSDELGIESLGVWDIAWSIISYFGILQGGVGASVNRYVAKYRTEDNAKGINDTVSSASCVQIIAGLLVIFSTCTTAWFLPNLIGSKLGELTYEAQWVIFFVGSGLAVQMFFSVFVGIITGYHRWDIHNGINAGIYALTTIAMASVLLMGGGLIELAFTSFAGTVVTEITRMIVGFKIAPSLRFRPSNVRLSVIKEQLHFGGKMLLPSISRLLMLQTTNVLIIAYLGPAMLAIFARPMALVQHVNNLLGKFAFVLTPVTSSMQAKNNDAEIRDLFLQVTQSAFYITLPMVLGLAILGEEVLHLWMGPEYASSALPAVLAIGHLATIVHTPVFSFLMGLNTHGRPAIAKFIAAITIVILVVLSLEFLDWGLLGVAFAITIPLIIVDGIYMPWFSCKKFNISLPFYYWKTIKHPVLMCLPYVGCLYACKLIFTGQPGATLIASAITGGMVITTLYWRYVLPTPMKEKIKDKFRGRSD